MQENNLDGLRREVDYKQLEQEGNLDGLWREVDYKQLEQENNLFTLGCGFSNLYKNIT